MPRKQKRIHYIYKTTCNVTNRYYIGMHSTNNLDDGYMGSGRRLRYSIRKYGKDNHTKEILEYYDTRELLIEAEIKAITPDMITDKNCMNLKGGGTGGLVSEDHHKKMREGTSIWNVKQWKKKEYRDKMSKMVSDRNKKYYDEGIREIFYFYDWNGKSHTEETKKKMSEARVGKCTGKANSQYGTCWITKDGKNKKIKKENLDLYITDGWTKGRKI